MQQGNEYSQTNFNRPVQNLPNATLVLVLGIISIISCCVYGVPSLILGVLALVLANKDTRLYMQDPSAYTVASYKNLKAGKTCAMIGLVMFVLFVVAIVVIFMTVGIEALSHPEMLRNYAP